MNTFKYECVVMYSILFDSVIVKYTNEWYLMLFYLNILKKEREQGILFNDRVNCNQVAS